MRLAISAVLAALALLAGCGGGGDQHASPEPDAAAPPASRWDSGPRAAESVADPALAGRGETLFMEKGCSACHAFGRKLSGPDLAGVAARRTSAWLEQQILHPDRMAKEDPIARELFTQFMLQMPNQGLNAEETAAIIEFLKRHDQNAGAATR